MNQGLKAAPLRGIVGCVDYNVLKTRPTAMSGKSEETAQS
jgi:hypothetical protein